MIYLLCTNFRGYNSTIGTFNLAWSGDVMRAGDTETRPDPAHVTARHDNVGAGADPHTLTADIRGFWTSKICREPKIDIFVLHSRLRVTQILEKF